MGWTPLATETHYTSQQSGRSTSPNMVILHHGATTSADQIIDMMVSGSRQVSAHCVVKDDRIAGVVYEENRAWSLGDAYWDSRAFTVETANESTDGWTISAASHESLARLCADWAARYGFAINRSGDPTSWTVIGHREVYEIYGGSYATACPGGMDLDWIAARANEILSGGDGDDEMKALIWYATSGSTGAYPQFPSIPAGSYWALGSPYDEKYVQVDKYKAQDMKYMGANVQETSGDNISVYVGSYKPLPPIPASGSSGAPPESATINVTVTPPNEYEGELVKDGDSYTVQLKAKS